MIKLIMLALIPNYQWNIIMHRWWSWIGGGRGLCPPPSPFPPFWLISCCKRLRYSNRAVMVNISDATSIATQFTKQ